MQFKRGAGERRMRDTDEDEVTMNTDSSQSGTPDSRSPFSFTRQGGAENAPGQQEPNEVPARAAAPAAPIESVVDSGAVVEGHFNADNDLRIQGTVSGEITCRGTLTIERTATAKAHINTQECEVHGTVDGDITCSGRLRFATTAVVNATIRAGSLVVEEGASIIGSIETNYSGEVTSAAASGNRRRGTNRKDEGAAAEGEDANRKSGTNRGREAPSFALVSSEDSAADTRESRSS